MLQATISADVITYTLLKEAEKKAMNDNINKFLQNLTDTYTRETFLGRLVQGDYIECAMSKPMHVLRIALLLKTLVKSMEFNNKSKSNSRLKHFYEHGIRLAIAITPLNKL